jgi:uncharacterized damage-inducible protein DinB
MWVNERLLEAARTLASDQLHQRFAIGQGSVWKSLLHLYAAEYVWLEALLGNEDPVAPGDLPGRLPGNQEGQGGIASFSDLQQEWANLTARWNSYLAGLTPEALDEQVYKKISSSGLRSCTSRADVLLHVCTHAQYTTAQLINMLRQTGMEKLPDPMLISMARQETAENTG